MSSATATIPRTTWSVVETRMAEEKHHHHFFHHHKEEGQPAEEQLAEEAVYSETAYSGGGDAYASGYTETVVVAESASDDYEKYKDEEKQHKHKEHLGKMGAVAAGAFALVALFDRIFCTLFFFSISNRIRPQ